MRVRVVTVAVIAVVRPMTPEPTVATQLEAIFDQESSGERAWAVTLEHGKLRWSDGKHTYDDSPEASGGQKFQAWLAKVLRLDSQL